MRLVDLVARYLERINAPPPLRSQPVPTLGWATRPDPAQEFRGIGSSPELSPLISDWPEEWREVFEERAGIMEFDAGLARPDAESRAAHWTRRLHLGEET